MLDHKLSQRDRILSMLQEEFPGYHPLKSLARIANRAEGEDDRLAADCNKALAKYIEPELKSIEVRSSDSEDGTMRVVLDGDFEKLPTPRPKAIERSESRELRTVAPAVAAVPIKVVGSE